YTGHHIAFLQLQKLADIEMEYVTFDGAAPSLQAFLGGNTDVLLGNSDDLMEQEDEMKILAIGSEKTCEPLRYIQTFIKESIEMEYVPFDGAATSLQAFLGGNTDVLLGNYDDLMEQEDEMKILAIGSEKTFEPLPDIPTFREEGFDMTAGIDRGVAVPPETDEKIIDKLESSFLDILDEDGVEEKMYEEGFEPLRMGHDESQEYIEEMTEEYSEIIEKVEN